MLPPLVGACVHVGMGMVEEGSNGIRGRRDLCPYTLVTFDLVECTLALQDNLHLSQPTLRVFTKLR